MTTHIFLGLLDLTMISLVVELGARKLDASMGRKEQKIAYGDGQRGTLPKPISYLREKGMT